jgi:hypothetical protein
MPSHEHDALVDEAFKKYPELKQKHDEATDEVEARKWCNRALELYGDSKKNGPVRKPRPNI